MGGAERTDGGLRPEARRGAGATMGRALRRVLRRPLLFLAAPLLGLAVAGPIVLALGLFALRLWQVDAPMSAAALTRASLAASGLLLLAGGIFAGGSVATAAGDAVRGRRASVGRSWGVAAAALPRLLATTACALLVALPLPVLGWTLLGGLGLLVGAIAVPALGAWWLLALPIGVLEARGGPAALRRSARLLRGGRLRALAVLGLGLLGSWAAMVALSLLVGQALVQLTGEWLIAQTQDLRAGFLAGVVLRLAILLPVGWLGLVVVTVASAELHHAATAGEPPAATPAAPAWRASLRPLAVGAVAVVAAFGVLRLVGSLRLEPASEPPPAPAAAPIEEDLRGWSRALRSDDPARRRDAARQATRFGPEAREAVPVLLAALRDPDPSVRRRVAEALEDVLAGDEAAAVDPLRAALHDEDAYVRVKAARGLARLAEAGREALPALRALRDDPQPAVRDAARGAILTLSDDEREVAEILVPELEGDVAGDRQEAADRLARGGAVTATVLEAHLHREELAHADLALDTLARIGAPGAPALARLLRHPQPARAHRAYAKLVSLGPAAEPALPVLRELLFTAPDPARRREATRGEQAVRGMSLAMGARGRGPGPLDLRHAVFRLLPRIGAPAVPVLLESLASGDADLRRRSGQALDGMDAARRSVDELLRLAEAGGVDHGAAALRAAARLAPEHPGLARLLERMLAEPDGRRRGLAVDVIGDVGPFDGRFVDAVVEELQRRPDARWATLDTLRTIGPADPETVLPALRRAWADPDVRVAAIAARALGALGPDAAPAVPELLARAQKEPRLRVAAAHAFGRIGPGARAALPLLLEMVGGPDHGERSAAISALGSVGPAERVLPALREALASPYFVDEAAASLAALGPAAEPALPEVGRALESASGMERVALVKALVAIGPAAIPTLEAAASGSQNRWVRRDAREALETLRGPAPAPAPPAARDATAQ